MVKLMCFQLVLVFILCKLKTEGLDWPVNQSSVKLLGLFPEQSQNDMWTIHCRSMFRSAIILSQEYNMTFEGQYLSYDEITTDDDIIVTVDRTCKKASTSNTVGFVGPAYSREVRYISSLANRLGIISVSYGASSPDLSAIDTGAFYRSVPSDENTVLSLKSLFEKYQWKSCIIIYQNDDYGYDGMRFLSEKFYEINIKTSEKIKYHINENKFDIDLQKTLINSSSRIIILWTHEKWTIPILNKALEENLISSDFLWILTSTISLNYFNQKQKQQLIGLITLEPVKGDYIQQSINTTLLDRVYQIWKSSEPETFPGNDNVSSYALFTFDATWSLILSLQKLCSMNLSCLQFLNLSNCYDRQFINSKQFYEIMKTISFLGVSGEIRFSNTTPDRIGHLYYIIKNIQPIDIQSNSIDFVPIFEYYVDSNQLTFYNNQSNQILWPDLSANVPLDLKLIKGEILRIAIIHSPPWIILKDPITKFSNMTDNYTEIDLAEFDGLFKDILLYLQKQMGFIPIVMLGKQTTEYDELINGVANGLYDTIMTGVSITTERARKVDFSRSIIGTSIRVMIRKPGSIYSDALFFFKPFSRELWGLIIGILIWTTILIYLFERWECRSASIFVNQNRNRNLSIVGSIKHVLRTMINRGPTPTVRTDAGRLLTFGLTIMQIILFAVYIASLTSSIITENSGFIISGLDDIKNGKILPGRVGMVVGNSIENYYLNFVSQGKKNYYPVKTIEELYTSLSNGNVDAAVWQSRSIQYYTNNKYCDLMAVGAELSLGTYGLPFKQDWLYKAELNSALLPFIESDEFDRLSVKWSSLRNCTDKDIFNPKTQPITIVVMRALFYFFASISGIAILIRLYPIIADFVRRKIQNRRRRRAIILENLRGPAIPVIFLADCY